MANRVQAKTNHLMYGLYNEPHEKAMLADKVEATPVREIQPKPAADEPDKLLTTLVGLM